MSNQQELVKAHDEIKRQISELIKLSESENKTSGILKLNAVELDITKEKDVSKLISAYAAIDDSNTKYQKAAEKMGLTNYPIYKVSNQSADSLLHDIKNRILFINKASKLKELEALEKEISSLFDKEAKAAQALKKVNSLIGTLALGEGDDKDNNS